MILRCGLQLTSPQSDWVVQNDSRLVQSIISLAVRHS